MQNVLIDTDVAIDFLRGKEAARKFIFPLWEKSLAHLSILSTYELFAGAHESEYDDTENFINACKVENIDREISEFGGKYYYKQSKKGITLTAIDCLIYATAKVRNYKIATRNIKHYPDKKSLVAIKWN